MYIDNYRFDRKDISTYLGSRKKSYFLVARPLRVGGKGRATKKKALILRLEKNVATKLEGGWGKALVAGPLKKELFCGFPKILKIDSVLMLMLFNS